VVSSITSWPIHASGIFSSEPEALGLSLSIIALLFFSVLWFVRVEQSKGMRCHQQKRCPIIAICATILVS
jgi:hypothetical protein